MEHLLERAAIMFGESTAIDDGSSQWSYQDLNKVVGQQSAALQSAGIQAGDRVAVLAKNRAEYAALYFACACLDAVLVPLNWRLTQGELQGILEDAEVALIFAESILSNNLGDRVWTDIAGFGSGDTADFVRQDGIVDGTVAVQMYTSGTSGKPKGAMLTHRNVTSMTLAWLLDMRVEHGDRFLQVTPLFHVGGMLMVLSVIAQGATLRLLPEFDPVAAIDVMGEEPITHALFVPAMVQWMLRDPHIQGREFPSLRLVVYGASPMPTATLERARAVFGCDFLQGYGLTESSGVLLTLTPSDHRACFEGEAKERLASAGRAAPGCRVRVVDDEGVDVGPGELGEIVARGDNLSPGYWNDSESTALAWRDGWFLTGDLAMADERGYITVVDRKKDMILVGGENVYPREVETVLAEHPDVEEAAVIGIPHAVWGEEVFAFVKPSRSIPENVQMDRSRGVLRHCREHLARYKCPTKLDWITELPRNAAGKVLKRDLRAPFWKDSQRLV